MGSAHCVLDACADRRSGDRAHDRGRCRVSRPPIKYEHDASLPVLTLSTCFHHRAKGDHHVHHLRAPGVSGRDACVAFVGLEASTRPEASCVAGDAFVVLRVRCADPQCVSRPKQANAKAPIVLLDFIAASCTRDHEKGHRTSPRGELADLLRCPSSIRHSAQRGTVTQLSAGARGRGRCRHPSSQAPRRSSPRS